MNVIGASRQPDPRVAGGMGEQDARAIAEQVHRGQRDRGGALLLDHVRRVAAAAPEAARTVAWLHEVLEYGAVSEISLLARGLSLDELQALRRLTRDGDSREEVEYLAHVAAIAGAQGPGAAVARTVKRADLEDRMRHPAVRADGWSPPYASGLAVLDLAATDVAPVVTRRFVRQHDQRGTRHGS